MHHYSVALVVGACLSLALAVSACSSSDRATPPPTTTTTTLVATPRPDAATLRCADAISSDPTPLAGFTIIFGRAGLTTTRVLQTAASGEPAPQPRLFAKNGLLVAADARFELVVPDAWKSRLSIGWGSPGPRTSDLVVAGCKPDKATDHWLGYAGGFWVDTPACVPLIVKTAGRQQLVHIAVGTPCRGA